MAALRRPRPRRLHVPGAHPRTQPVGLRRPSRHQRLDAALRRPRLRTHQARGERRGPAVTGRPTPGSPCPDAVRSGRRSQGLVWGRCCSLASAWNAAHPGYPRMQRGRPASRSPRCRNGDMPDAARVAEQRWLHERRADAGGSASSASPVRRGHARNLRARGPGPARCRDSHRRLVADFRHSPLMWVGLSLQLG